jgi:hypothetical protein
MNLQYLALGMLCHKDKRGGIEMKGNCEVKKPCSELDLQEEMTKGDSQIRCSTGENADRWKAGLRLKLCGTDTPRRSL